MHRHPPFFLYFFHIRFFFFIYIFYFISFWTFGNYKKYKFLIFFLKTFWHKGLFYYLKAFKWEGKKKEKKILGFLSLFTLNSRRKQADRMHGCKRHYHVAFCTHYTWDFPFPGFQPFSESLFFSSQGTPLS